MNGNLSWCPHTFSMRRMGGPPVVQWALYWMNNIYQCKCTHNSSCTENSSAVMSFDCEWNKSHINSIQAIRNRFSPRITNCLTYGVQVSYLFVGNGVGYHILHDKWYPAYRICSNESPLNLKAEAFCYIFMVVAFLCELVLMVLLQQLAFATVRPLCIRYLYVRETSL